MKTILIRSALLASVFTACGYMHILGFSATGNPLAVFFIMFVLALGIVVMCNRVFTDWLFTQSMRKYNARKRMLNDRAAFTIDL